MLIEEGEYKEGRSMDYKNSTWTDLNLKLIWNNRCHYVAMSMYFPYA